MSKGARAMVAAACLATVACGGSHRAPPQRASATATAAPPCPAALKPTDDAPRRVEAATRRGLRHALPGISLRGSSMRSVASLDGARAMPHFSVGPYLAPATRACGADVAERSWIAFVWLPNAPFARIAAAAIYTVRTRSGWEPWFVWFPFDKTGHRVPPAP